MGTATARDGNSAAAARLCRLPAATFRRLLSAPPAATFSTSPSQNSPPRALFAVQKSCFFF
ncbi:hypothetical protein PanWU01x14_341790 [Parasponia andersonii]|uniref:Uncharacterized protein n=1 Tax=Parasponia andersonii TaxID=3476 RepID=A0A2P5ADY3_PARAD|nr:hypothetical protein PanWU01x14_341790 [Parasponia andersonii]